MALKVLYELVDHTSIGRTGVLDELDQIKAEDVSAETVARARQLADWSRSLSAALGFLDTEDQSEDLVEVGDES